MRLASECRSTPPRQAGRVRISMRPGCALTRATNAARDAARGRRPVDANRDLTRDQNRDQRTNADRIVAISVRNEFRNKELSKDQKSGRPDSNRRRPAWEHPRIQHLLRYAPSFRHLQRSLSGSDGQNWRGERHQQ